MKCPKCNLNANIAKVEYKTELNSTDIYLEQTHACVNPNCGIYAGKDLSNPKQIIEIVRTKIN